MDNAHDQHDPRTATLNQRGRFASFLTRTLTHPGYFFTACVAVLTLAYVGISYFQLRALYQSNEGAQRAWHTVKGLHEPFLAVVGGSAELNVDIENTGRSPAQRIVFSPVTAVQLLDWSPPDPLPTDPNQKAVNVLGPSHSRSLAFERNARFTADEIDAINKGRAVLFYVAMVTYRDQFSDSRGLRFCLRYVPPADGKPVTYMLACSAYDAVW